MAAVAAPAFTSHTTSFDANAGDVGDGAFLHTFHVNGLAAPTIKPKDPVCFGNGVFTRDVVKNATTGTLALFDVVEIKRRSKASLAA